MNITLPSKAASFMASQREQAAKQRARLGVEARSWYRITNAADDEAEVMLYDEVGGWLGATADEFINDLRGITASNILLRVNSPGGSVTEGIAIANALRSHPANVTVQVDGIAASIASVIAMAGDQVRMMPNALLMVHEASGLCVGDAAEMIKMAEVLDKISGNIADAYATRAGGTRDEWRQVMRNETWYTAEEAVKAGLADEAVPSKKQAQPEPDGDEPEPEMRRAFDLAAYGYQGPKQPETPKPTPPPAAPEQVTLTFNLGETFGPELVEMLRKSVERRGEPVAASVPEVVDTASPVHHTATEDRPWDASPNLKRLPSPMTVATAKAMFAWYDESSVEDGEITKDACSLPHHEVSADGKPGAANLSGVRNALSRLPQSNIPASQHDAVRRHLQAHLDDAKSTDNTAEVDPTAAVEEPAAETVPDDDWAVLTGRLIEPIPDPWAAAVAHLTQDDAWTGLVSHLIEPAKSSSATAA